MGEPTDIDMRCSVVAFRDDSPSRTAAYLGNLWRPGDGNGTSAVPEAAR